MKKHIYKTYENTYIQNITYKLIKLLLLCKQTMSSTFFFLQIYADFIGNTVSITALFQILNYFNNLYVIMPSLLSDNFDRCFVISLVNISYYVTQWKIITLDIPTSQKGFKTNESEIGPNIYVRRLRKCLLWNNYLSCFNHRCYRFYFNTYMCKTA